MDIAIRGWGGEPDVTGSRAQQIKRDWVARHSGAENVDAILQSMKLRDDLRERLGEIAMPVLIVHGEKDATWSLKHAEEIRDGLVTTKVHLNIVRDSGHLVLWMRDSEDVSAMVVDFVDGAVPHNGGQ